MGFAERAPRGRLRGVVERLWLVEDSAPDSSPETICPDGTMEIVLHFGDLMRQQVAGRERVQPRALLVGQMDAPIVIAASGAMSMVGARFAPGAFHRVVAMPQHRLAREIHDLTCLSPRWTRDTTDRVACTRGTAARLDVFESALEQLVPDADRPLALPRAIARLRATHGLAAIDGLARNLGISRRQFERRFQDHVGLSPRLFARILKFQHAFQALDASARAGASGADIAARCGYADQAHMVREIRRFAGQTPSVLAQADGLTAFFRA
jgi:AraC-like DNA-binding protein